MSDNSRVNNVSRTSRDPGTGSSRTLEQRLPQVARTSPSHSTELPRRNTTGGLSNSNALRPRQRPLGVLNTTAQAHSTVRPATMPTAQPPGREMNYNEIRYAQAQLKLNPGMLPALNAAAEAAGLPSPMLYMDAQGNSNDRGKRIKRNEKIAKAVDIAAIAGASILTVGTLSMATPLIFRASDRRSDRQQVPGMENTLQQAVRAQANAQDELPQPPGYDEVRQADERRQERRPPPPTYLAAVTASTRDESQSMLAAGQTVQSQRSARNGVADRRNNLGEPTLPSTQDPGVGYDVGQALRHSDQGE